jgi:CRISPR type III-A-associated protein Csm2
MKVPAKLDGISAEDLHDLAKENASIFVKKDRLKTHQLRNVFSAVEKSRNTYRNLKMEEGKVDESVTLKSIEDLVGQLILLKPKIAYAAGRQKTVRYNFFPFVSDSINAVKNAQDKDKALENFFILMESVVGYHKFFETDRG